MYSSTAFAPSSETAAPDLDSFAAFLEKLALVDSAETPARQPEPSEYDPSLLSYEHALRRPPSSQAALAVAEPKPTALADTAERRTVRASICLSVTERDLLRQRAGESNLSVSAYVRSCIFEVESLREQVRQFMEQMRTSTTHAPQPAIAAPPQTPVLAAPPRQAALPVQQEPRRPPSAQQPAQTRAPQAAPRYSNPRVQAAIEEQKRVAAQQAARKQARKPEPKPGLFGFFFGARKTA